MCIRDRPCSHHLQVGAGGRCQRQGCPETGHTRLFMQGGRELMKNEIEAMITDITTTTAEAEDYTGEDGLLYCGKCHTPKEAYFPKETAQWLGQDVYKRQPAGFAYRHCRCGGYPSDCLCQREKREEIPQGRRIRQRTLGQRRRYKALYRPGFSRCV